MNLKKINLSPTKNIKKALHFHDREKTVKSFEDKFLILKIVFCALLVIMSVYYPIKYKTVGLISEKPYTMLFESFIFGLSGVLPFLMLSILRNKVYTINDIIKISIFVFVIFFIMNYLFELSGFYSYSFSKDESVLNDDNNLDPKKKFIHTLDVSLRTLFLITVGVLLFIMIMATLFIRDTTINYNYFNSVKWIVFFVESLIFGLISAGVIYLVAYDRNKLQVKETSFEFLLLTIKFFILNLVLQFSGFYNNIFVGK